MRPAAATAVLGVALAVAAPTTWVLTRPEATAGAPVEQALGVPSSPTVTPPGPGRLPTVARARRLRRPGAHPRPCVCGPGAGVDAASTPWVCSRTARWPSRRRGPGGLVPVRPAPGADGSAVIAGHVDDREQGLGAMAPLRDGGRGRRGGRHRFRRGDDALAGPLPRADPEAGAAAGPPVRPRGAARLTLITCGGPFLPEFGSYRDNVVVVTEPLR